MTSIRIIILAQGTQERMGLAIPCPKQLLRLPVCADAAILHRTLVQVGHLYHDIPGADIAPSPSKLLERPDFGRPWRRPTVVAGRAISAFVQQEIRAPLRPRVVTLPDPGNSSLKGIWRYLNLAAASSEFGDDSLDDVADLNVVLLGDVVYSWECLRKLLRPRSSSAADITFCGTSDLSRSAGELWGVAWNEVADDQMMTTLAHAVSKHPPHDQVYQPGQMRRWLWEFSPSASMVADGNKVFEACDDYTRDIDLPAHATPASLLQLSAYAAADDRKNGVVW